MISGQKDVVYTGEQNNQVSFLKKNGFECANNKKMTIKKTLIYL